MTFLVLAAFFLADPVPQGARAAAARVEADAFAALEEKRDCDAAATFLRAAELGADDRLLMNAGLAFARAGDRQSALTAFARIVDPALVPSAAQRSNAMIDQARRIGPGARCPAPVSVSSPSHASSSSAPAPSSPSLLPWGIAAVAGGVAVAGSAAGIWFVLDQTVLQNPSSSGAAKSAALGSSPALIAGGSLGGLLVITGVTLIPVSLGEAS